MKGLERTHEIEMVGLCLFYVRNEKANTFTGHYTSHLSQNICQKTFESIQIQIKPPVDKYLVLKELFARFNFKVEFSQRNSKALFFASCNKGTVLFERACSSR